MKMNREQANVLTALGPRAVLRWYRRWLDQSWPSAPALRDCLHSLGADLSSPVFKKRIAVDIVVDKLPSMGKSQMGLHSLGVSTDGKMTV